MAGTRALEAIKKQIEMAGPAPVQKNGAPCVLKMAFHTTPCMRPHDISALPKALSKEHTQKQAVRRHEELTPWTRGPP